MAARAFQRLSQGTVAASIALALNAYACSEPAHEESSLDLGPDSAPVPLMLRPGYYIGETDTIQFLFDGDELPVRLATQGGFASFVGARVDGLEPGAAEITAELVNPDTSKAFVTDTRMVELLKSPDGSGEVEPDASSTSNFSHLLVCPNYEARPVHGLEWILNLRMNDPSAKNHEGSASVRVIPTCMPGFRYEQCVCECEPFYVFEKCGAPH